MRAHRLSLAIVATTATVCGLVSPVAMADTPGSSSQTGSSSTAPQSENHKDAPKTDATEQPTEKPKEKTPEQLEAEKKVKECEAANEQAIEKRKEEVKNGTAGSSFLGPMELLKSIFKGFGFAGMPELQDCSKLTNQNSTNATPEQEEPEFPEGLESARLTPEAKEGFGWAKMVISVLAIVLQVAVFMARVNPSMLDPLRDLAHRAGIKF